MHSETYDVEIKGYSSLLGYTTQRTESFRVHRNGDYSGDIEFTLNVRQLHDRIDMDNPDDPDAIAHIDLPYDLLEQIVLDKMRSELISKIEQMEQSEFKEVLRCLL